MLALLSACASGPQKNVGRDNGRLAICPGMAVSNAPPADRRGYLIDYNSQATVAGRILARAPVQACLSSGFGPRRGGAGNVHRGVDLYTRAPRAVYAAGDGVVESVGALRGYGRTILIAHNARVQTRYAHLSAFARGLKPGARVRAGEVIGKTGDSGNATAVHLHYEIIVDGRPRNPLTIAR